MSNLLSDIFESHTDFSKTQTKSNNSGILKNKPEKTFSVFKEKTGAVDFDKIVQFLTTPKKDFQIHDGEEKKIKGIVNIIWYVIFFAFIILGNLKDM